MNISCKDATARRRSTRKLPVPVVCTAAWRPYAKAPFYPRAPIARREIERCCNAVAEVGIDTQIGRAAMPMDPPTLGS